MNIRGEIVDLLQNGQLGKIKRAVRIGKKFVESVKYYSSSNVSEYGDFLISLSEILSVYPSYDLFLTTQNALKKVASQSDLLTLDNYILSQYCLAQGEDISRIFNGKVSDKYNRVRGRMFLTNLRIIGCGFKSTITAPPMVGQPRMNKVISHWRKSVQLSRTAQTFSDGLQESELLTWGNSYPLYKAEMQKRSKSSITCNIKVPYKTKNGYHVEKLKIGITHEKQPERIEIINDM